MGDLRGFLKVKRREVKRRAVCERIKNFKEVVLLPDKKETSRQASRCMDCGVPFCHWACPVGNYIPEWNDFAYHKKWQQAFNLLNAANNLPEVTGRVCPAPCEYACVLGISDEPTAIRDNELAIAEYAFKEGLIKPSPPKKRTGKKVAVVGSGPAGIAASDQLNKAGHKVVVFEQDEAIGGIMRFGIPDFKLSKKILDRRINLLRKEGIIFKTGIKIGVDKKLKDLIKEYDAVLLAAGSRAARDLKIPGRGLKGIHFAMDYLAQANRRVAGKKFKKEELIDAKGKKVVVVGGGDTGADCVGVANRQQAACITQIEIMPRPPECRGTDEPWPKYPMLLKSSTSHEEGGERHWSVMTKAFEGSGGEVKKLKCRRVKFKPSKSAACPMMQEITDSDFEIEADLVILALGFLHPEHKDVVKELNLSLDNRGNIKTDNNFKTSGKKVFTAGDMRRGQSLIVWAISEGRQAAFYIDKHLMGRSSLPCI
jgi:glutamate synthase (NADPH) small chain